VKKSHPYCTSQFIANQGTVEKFINRKTSEYFHFEITNLFSPDWSNGKNPLSNREDFKLLSGLQFLFKNKIAPQIQFITNVL